MKILARWTAIPSPCGYLPDRLGRTEFLRVDQLDPDEYQAYMLAGWRRFGYSLIVTAAPCC